MNQCPLILLFFFPNHHHLLFSHPSLPSPLLPSLLLSLLVLPLLLRLSPAVVYLQSVLGFEERQEKRRWSDDNDENDDDDDGSSEESPSLPNFLPSLSKPFCAQTSLLVRLSEFFSSLSSPPLSSLPDISICKHLKTFFHPPRACVALAADAASFFSSSSASRPVICICCLQIWKLVRFFFCFLNSCGINDLP